MKAYNKRRYAANPISHQRVQMIRIRQKAYGLTDDGYRLMLQSQSGLCAICHKQETIFSKRHNKTRELSVDHCHATGRVRGLLCNSCNNGLARFKDSPELLLAAINYLAQGGVANATVQVGWEHATAGAGAGLL